MVGRAGDTLQMTNQQGYSERVSAQAPSPHSAEAMLRAQLLQDRPGLPRGNPRLTTVTAWGQVPICGTPVSTHRPLELSWKEGKGGSGTLRIP